MGYLEDVRDDARAVDLGGPKFEIKYKSCSFQKSKLANWGGQACQLGGQASPWCRPWRICRPFSCSSDQCDQIA